MEDSYNTIEESNSSDFRDRGSKFIAYLFPCDKEAVFNEKMKVCKADHVKARHHCYAYRLKTGLERSSDDGEPSGTAGQPIMNQLYSNGLVDVACIVVRYFGGTKLGVSGLINAYKQATKMAIETNSIVLKFETIKLKVTFQYDKLGVLMDILKRLKLKIISKELNAQPYILIEVNKSEGLLTIVKLKALLLNRSIEDIKEEDKIENVDFEILESN